MRVHYTLSASLLMTVCWQAVFHLDQALRFALGGQELRIAKAEYLTYLNRISDAEDIVK